MRKALIAACSGLVVLIACGSDDPDGPSTPAKNDAGSSSSGGFSLPDGSAPADTGPGTTAPTCPVYQSLCNSACIPTTDDPANCGGCGVACGGTQACSAGKCSDTCQPGLDICDHRCADRQTDNNNCGTCGNACGAGKGCVAGQCVNAVVVGATPGKCTGGGPPISETPEQGGCLGALAQKTFRWSLCSCTNIAFSAPLTADAYDSTQGPYAAGSIGGGIGANGNESAANTALIGGDLWAHGDQGLITGGQHDIKHDLRLNGKLQTSAAFNIGNDAWVNGDVLTSSTVTVGGELRVPAGKQIAASGVTAKTTTRQDVTFPEPCDCDAAQLVPTVAIAHSHAGANNDNAAIQLDPDALALPTAATRLDLPCGQYFLSKIGGAFPITIAAHGRTALYIDGDIQTTGDLAFIVDPTGELDIFVSGTVNSSAQLRIGSPNYPALTRTYVGTTNGVDLAANIRIAGNLYVGNGRISWSAPSDLYGAVFANDFVASAETRLHYDRAVLHAGDVCGAPAGGASCGSCRDCNNQACTGGKCGACQTSADCCSPLSCVSGECIAAIK